MPRISRLRWKVAVSMMAAAILLPACEKSGGDSQPSGTVNHVFIVVEENAPYDDVVGNPEMPYLNNLIQGSGLATRYHANTHPSIGNYFMLTTGKIITNNNSFAGVVSEDNIVRRLLEAGKTWKSYAEDLPSPGFLELAFDNGTYASRHNPVVHFSDVRDDPAQAGRVVPLGSLATDLATNELPNFALIIPNLVHNAHSGSLSAADQWLETHIEPLIRSDAFQKDGLLIITFDEATGHHSGGGGRVAWVVVSPRAKKGHVSATFFQHESTLRFVLKALGVASFPGAAATAPDVDGFLTP